MELLIKRQPSETDGTPGGMMTIGQLFVNQMFQCLTLEDQIRPTGEFVFGKTAIPAGRYQITINRSNRFSQIAGHDVMLPLIFDLPGNNTMFGAHGIDEAGCRLHAGNDEFDTEGCILLGLLRGKVLDKNGKFLAYGILQSATAFAAVFALISAALAKSEAVYLTIQNS